VPSAPSSERADAGGDVLVPLMRPCGCPRFRLTDREQAVLEQLAEGKSTREAAQCLYVSDQAITYHVGNLLTKFQCRSRTGVISRAFVLGILDPIWPPRIVRAAGSNDATGSCQHGMKVPKGRRTLSRS
jgi:DNA-binding CsgD family transcriptional regulator